MGVEDVIQRKLNTMQHLMIRPEDDFGYFNTYINPVRDEPLPQLLEKQLPMFDDFVASLPAEKADYAYAPGKWTVKQCIRHIIDTERVFAYRLMAISRGEKQPLPGFNQDEWAQYADVSNVSLNDLSEEFDQVRKATIALVKSISPEQAAREGVASNNPIVARGFPALIAGHLRHHMNVFKEKYGL